jgi:hypothetical protein
MRKCFLIENGDHPTRGMQDQQGSQRFRLDVKPKLPDKPFGYSGHVGRG